MTSVPLPKTIRISFEHLGRMLTPTRVALVMMARRIGVVSFSVFLEYRHFTPGTPANEHFICAIAEWEQITWIVIIIHKMHLEKADALAKLLGLRRADGIPRLICLENGRQVVKSFPLDGPNVWTMENIEGHFTYKNNPELERKAREFEKFAANAEIEEHYKRYRGIFRR